MQRQAMGVALHIVLLPFFELLHSTIDSYDADFNSRLFFASCFSASTLKGTTTKPGGKDEHFTRSARATIASVRPCSHRSRADARSHTASAADARSAAG